MSDFKEFRKIEKIDELYQKAKQMAIVFGADPSHFEETDKKLAEIKAAASKKVSGGYAVAPGILSFDKPTTNTMSQQLSVETAKKLKEAGFPEPEPKAGQTWFYTTINEHFILTDGLTQTAALRRLISDGAIYCPSVQDFMEQMPGAVIKTTGGHYGLFFNEGSSDEIVFTDANLLEACALAWLHLNKKPEAAKFPEFWYESNASYGRVTNMQELASMAVAQLEENNGINTVEMFLLHSYKSHDLHSFGTGSNHTSAYRLYDFLIDHYKPDFLPELEQAIADLQKTKP